MRKFLFIAFAVIMVQTSSFAQAVWNSDKVHSKLNFSVIHSGISEIEGLFKDFDVKATATKADFSDAVFELTADVKSIDTEVEMRDNHLRSADFFDADKFEKITFKSTSIKPNGKNKYILGGDLTMHGVTMPVKMNLLYRGTIVNPKTKANIAGFQLTGTLKRSMFDIGPGFKAPMISDEVQIKADGEFISK